MKRAWGWVWLAGCAVGSAGTRPATGEVLTVGATPPVDPCVATQPYGSGGLAVAWAAPDGTVYASGWPATLQIRSPDGGWSEEGVPFEGIVALSGSAAGTVWALSEARLGPALLRRDAPGVWTSFPIDGAPHALVVVDDTRVEVLVDTTDDVGCIDCSIPSATAIWTWSAGRWTTRDLPESSIGFGSLGRLSDGTLLVSPPHSGEVSVVTPGNGLAPLPDAVGVGPVAVGSDDTVVAIGTSVFVGTVDGGLVENRPPTSVYGFSAVWVGDADHYVVATEDWESGVNQVHELWAWDDGAWELLVPSRAGGVTAIVGAEDALVAVGDWEHRLVYAGDVAGLEVDRETWGLDGLGEIAIDRTEGVPYGFGYGDLVARWNGASWDAFPLTLLTSRPDRIAADSGRVVVVGGNEVAIWQDGVATIEPLDEDVFWYAVATSQGTSFLLGTDRRTGQAQGLWETGSGWVPMPLPGFPADAEPHTAWADSPTEVVVGVELPTGGGLVRWDGASWTVLTDQLPEDPDWLSREVDGELYVTQFVDAGRGQTVHRVLADGTIEPLDGFPPDVRSGHLRADGSWIVSTIAEVDTDEGRDLVGRLLEGTPGQPFEQLLEADHVVPLGVVGETVFAGADDGSWTRSCEP